MKNQQTKNMEGREMLKKLKTFIALAALSTTTVSANVQAATLMPQLRDQVHTLQVSAEDHNLWGDVLDSNLGVVQVTKWNHIINPFIHPSFIAFENIIKQPAAAVSTPELAAVVKPAEAPAKVAPVAVPKVVPTPVITAAVPAAPTAPVPAPAPVQEAAAPVKEVVAAAAPAPSPAPTADVAAKPAEPSSTEAEEPADNNKEITVKATAYTASCEGCSGITATGVNIKDNPDEKVIAVDPDVIPLGSKVYVEGVGEATAADTGGAIKGNRIDVFIPSEEAALKFGVKHLKVTILN
jgi:3D (Asp-Asp-Asp) domain-containing protein